MSKVDRYIVYRDGEAKSVWATRAAAEDAARRTYREYPGRVEVLKHPKSGIPFLVASVRGRS